MRSYNGAFAEIGSVLFSCPHISSRHDCTGVVTNHIIISKKVSLCNVIFYIVLISMENRNQVLQINLICFQSDLFVKLTVGYTLSHEHLCLLQ